MLCVRVGFSQVWQDTPPNCPRELQQNAVFRDGFQSELGLTAKTIGRSGIEISIEKMQWNVFCFWRERERCVIRPRRRRRLLLLLSSQFSTVTQSLSLSLSTRRNSSGIELFGGCILTCHSTCRRVEEFPVVVPSREKERKNKRPRDTLPLHTYLIFLILIFSARSGILFFSINPETVKYKPNHTHTDTHSKWRWVLKKKKKKKKEPTVFWLCRCRPPRDDDDPSPSNAAAALGARKMLYKTKMSAHWATERYPVHLGDSALLVWAVTYTKSWPLLRRRRRRRRRLISPDTMLFFILYAYLNVLLLLLVYLPVLNSRQTL